MSTTIALVDDDRNILTSVSIALQAEGYVTRSDFDAKGQRTGTTHWATPITTSDTTTFAQVTAALSGATETRAWQYDSLGRTTRATDALGNVAWDKNGTPIEPRRLTDLNLLQFYPDQRAALGGRTLEDFIRTAGGRALYLPGAAIKSLAAALIVMMARARLKAI